jgi:UDP-N-acetylmuramoyl-tripeptide--D-alanyl-D-alanine ligase
MRLTAIEIARATCGTLKGRAQDALATGVSVDTRTILRGDVFFALKGPNFNGHDFVNDAVRKGASCIVAAAKEGPTDSACVIEVEDTLSALGDLASFVRGLYDIPVVAVSGSAGKTTTKEMIASILSRSRNSHKTVGNRNNLVGLPLTIFGLESDHGAAVVELGISEHWEMERLVEISRPDVAVLTNIGRGHLATLGTLEGVAEAKGPLFTITGPGCVRVVNLDDPWAVRLAASSMPAVATSHLGAEWEAGGKEVTFSMEEDADVRVVEYRILDDLAGISVVFDVMGADVCVRLSSPSVCNISNAAAAVAATLPLGATNEDIIEGLASFTNMPGRMEVKRVGDITVLDDTYNANPDSVDEALKTLKTACGRKVAVLGDMLELGDGANASHFEAGRLAAVLGVDLLIAVGENAAEIIEGGLSEGLTPSFVHGFRDNTSAIEAISGLLRNGDSVLVKGSRGAGLEEIVEGIRHNTGS